MSESMHAQWDDYEDFVAEYNANTETPNFVADEFLYLGGSHNDATSRCANLNWYPDRALWPSIFELATLLQAVRDDFGHAIFLTSIYRNPSYNSCIGGASNSYHMKAMAADCVPVNGSVSALYNSSNTVNANGGVGRYSTFVHNDIRGHRARW